MPTPEGQILTAILQYLAAKHIFAMRMNTGAVASEYKGKKRFVRFGTPGCADILAFKTVHIGIVNIYTVPVWIEAKTAKGKQSELQKSFQWKVESEGHLYIIARGIEDVERYL